jgi:hypothetical protein
MIEEWISPEGKMTNLEDSPKLDQDHHNGFSFACCMLALKSPTTSLATLLWNWTKVQITGAKKRIAATQQKEIKQHVQS